MCTIGAQAASVGLARADAGPREEMVRRMDAEQGDEAPGTGPEVQERIGMRTFGVVGVVVVAVLLAMFGLRQTFDADAPAQPSAGGTEDTPGPTEDVALELGVWGTDEEVGAYRSVVDDYNASADHVEVTVRAWPDAQSMNAAIESGEAQPDLYLLPREDLAATMAEQRNVPLLDLLDARGVNLGDDYSRDSVAAFSADDDLQCMPYGTSPQVIYYNTDLIDFDAMAQRDLPVPNEERTSWSLEAFAAAAEFGTKPVRGIKGVAIEPTLEGLAPFVLSGGGQIFDDPVAPTSLALSEDSSAEATRRTLEVLRDPSITLRNQQLRRKSPAEWFAEGRVAMIAGYRDLTPQLRDVEGLSFDVISMPSLGTSATVGELTGLCIAPGDAGVVASAADVLAYLVSDEAVARVAEVGYLHPSHVQVAFSDAFLQPARLPAHAVVFNEAAGSIVPMPLLEDPAALDAAVARQVRELFTRPDLGDLDSVLAEIDESSASVLDPEESVPTDEPEDLPSEGSGEVDPGSTGDDAGAAAR